MVKPGRPSEDYLLRKLLYCERCSARMHGNRRSSGKIRRYHCSTRRHGDGCDQPLAHAEPLEAQIVDWLRGFQPDAQPRIVVLATLRQAAAQANDGSSRRRDLDGQLERLRDLYVMGDVTKTNTRCGASPSRKSSSGSARLLTLSWTGPRRCSEIFRSSGRRSRSRQSAAN